MRTVQFLQDACSLAFILLFEGTLQPEAGVGLTDYSMISSREDWLRKPLGNHLFVPYLWPYTRVDPI